MKQNPPNAPPIKGIKFRNATWLGLGMETLRLADLWQRAPERGFERPQRPAFHHLILCTEGHGWHQVDFVRHELKPGTLIHVQPEQVQSWQYRSPAEALMVIFEPSFLMSERSSSGKAVLIDAFWPTSLQIQEADHPRIFGAFQDLHREYQATDGSPLSTRLLQHLLHAVLLRLHQTRVTVGQHNHPESNSVVFRLFLEEVERAFARTRDVGVYAQRLGYSARTLSRASQAVQGRSAKDLIDARVVLEAKRLLAHSDLTIAQVAVALGFSEATNFVKFFQRLEGTPPGAFRQQQRLER